MTDAPKISLTLYSRTDVGMVRSGNEDNFLILDLTTGTSWTAGEPSNERLQKFNQGYYGSLLAVSDGMGGALAGEVASRLAVETVRDRMLQLQAHRVYRQLPFFERLRLSIEEANLLINSESVSNPEHKGLGATFTAAAVYANRVFFAQVGDSRAYLIRQGKIIRITKDQSLVQQLIDAGQITEEEAETHSYRNVILQALGAHGNVNVEVNAFNLCANDVLVLCSDGLSGKVRADEIVRMIDAASNLSQACEHLIALANERGGEDNITVLIVKFGGSGLPPPPPDGVDLESLPRSAETPTELNWEIDSETESLTSEKAEMIQAGATEELPAPPPSHFTRSQADRPRPSAEFPRQTGSRPRTEPITSVFSAEEFDESYVPIKDKKSNNDPIPGTPAAAASGDNQSAAVKTSDPPSPGSEFEAARKLGPPPPATSRQRHPLLIAMYGLLAVLVAVLATYWYLTTQEAKRKEVERQATLQQKAIERSEKKQSLINRLQDRIVTVERNLVAAETAKNRDKREKIQEQLAKVKAKVEEVRQLSPDQMSEIEKSCDDIEKKLIDLQVDIDKLANKQLRGRLHPEENAGRSVDC